MDLLERFWALMRSEFGYGADSPSVAGLLRQLFITELFHQTDDAPMDALAHHRLPPVGRRNAVVFLTQWRDSSGKASSYDAAAAAVAAEQRIGEHLGSLNLETIRGVYTFWEAERRVVSRLKDRLLDETHAVDRDAVADIASERKAGHWLSGPGSEHAERSAIADAYEAIVAAADLFALHRTHRNALHFDTPAAILTAYQKELYQFDRLYRRFCTGSGPALGQGWDLLKTLSEAVERVYDQGFLQPLGVEWSRLLDEGFSAAMVPAEPARPAGFLRPAHRTPPAGFRAQARLCHHQRCVPLRGGSGPHRVAEWPLPHGRRAVGHAGRTAFLHRARHGQSVAP